MDQLRPEELRKRALELFAMAEVLHERRPALIRMAAYYEDLARTVETAPLFRPRLQSVSN